MCTQRVIRHDVRKLIIQRYDYELQSLFDFNAKETTASHLDRTFGYPNAHQWIWKTCCGSIEWLELLHGHKISDFVSGARGSNCHVVYPHADPQGC